VERVIAELAHRTELVIDGAAPVEGLSEQAADARLRVRMHREEALALRYEIVVTPQPEGGTAFAPGAGAARLAAGGVVSVRDLAAERRALRELLAALGLSEAEGIVSGPLELYAFLERLGQSDAVAEWPAGEPMRVRKLRPEEVKLRFGGGTEWLEL